MSVLESACAEGARGRLRARVGIACHIRPGALELTAAPTWDNCVQHAFRLIVFDFDGTLVDSQGQIVAAMETAFTAAGHPAPEAAAVRRTVGLRLESAVARLLPEPDWPVVEELSQGYREAATALRQRQESSEALFPGARAALERLDRTPVSLGIATGKGRRGLSMSLERHEIGHHFTVLKTADDGPGKPAPDILRQAMAEVGVAPEETVVIGDTTFDVEMARNAGVRAVGVAWGYHESQELIGAGAGRVIDHFEALAPTLAAMEGSGS
jgi:phosphoglycolate phosphatase